jgi:glutamine synthetase
MNDRDAATKLAELKRVAQGRGIEFYFAQFVDLYGRPSAKLVPAAYLDELVENGAGFAGFAAGELGQAPSDPDIAAIPDLDSFTPVPWQSNLARFACDVTVEGGAWGYCPRTILRRVLARARELGYEFMLGLELEYFLVRRRADGSIEVADEHDTLEKPCYDMAGLTRHYDFLTTISNYCNELGWGNYANDHEDANGQFEQNFRYDEALVSCDRAVFFRYMVHTLAEQLGMIATFMPKPFTALTGSGAHFHMSLWRDGQNAFLDPDDQRGLGLSETAYRFIGGLKAHARASSALTAPTVNSYKRLKAGSTTSGATWSPVWISYGHNNRTQMLRVPGPGRIEDRTVDGSANPYLAAAAELAAGLDGIENGLDAGDPNAENLYVRSHEELSGRGLRTLPANLLEAIGALEQDDVLRGALGRGRGEDYIDYYARVKRDEWFRYHEQVTAWELNEYLTRF